jgi:hypothetical protein
MTLVCKHLFFHIKISVKTPELNTQYNHNFLLIRSLIILKSLITDDLTCNMQLKIDYVMKQLHHKTFL